MKVTTTQTQQAYAAAWKGGTDRPMQRATIQRLSVVSTQYTLPEDDIYEAAKGAKGVVTTIPFAQRDQPVELPNIKSIQWQRSVESEVATMTMTLWNCEVLPLGQAPDPDVDVYERPGYFTPTRGEGESATRFGQTANGWQGLLVPDRIIRTYEGYGFDNTVGPEDDVHMYPSGVWMIDEVAYDARGTITVSCRDIGRALIDQIAFPPVVPFEQYPVQWSAYVSKPNPDVEMTTQGWFRPAYDKDSNLPYIGAGLTDGGRPYVSSNGSVRGHNGKHAFDSSRTTYWMSVGNYPSWSSAYEYVQGKFSSRTITAVKIKTWGGPYKVYVSVYADGKWQGRSKIPYRSRLIDTGADIRFSASKTVKKNKETTIRLPKAISGATKVRITFTDLYDSGIGQYQYRAGCYDVQVTGGITKMVDGGSHLEGNYGDYTDIVKWFLAWGGWHWPSSTSGNAFITQTDGTVVNLNPTSDDPVFPNGLGRVWGDLEQTGTKGKIDLGIEIFDKKPLLDAIAYVRDIVAYSFFIDETGGAIFRSPNIWQVGNYLSTPDGGPNAGRTTDVLTLDDQAIMDLAVKISSKNVREKIFVANVNGRFGAMAAGFNKYPSGLRRIAGWTDQNFETEEECQIMADLIAIRAMFRYRTDTVSIPGNPAIQIDDQVRILEETTSETYFHYVKSIGSNFDMETGKWTYSLETFWLGTTPLTKDWAFNALELSEETKRYLGILTGSTSGGGVDIPETPPPIPPVPGEGTGSGSGGAGGGSGTQPTGAGIVRYQDLSSLGHLSDTINSAGSSNRVSFASGTYTFSNFGKGPQTISPGAFARGLDINVKGLLGAGANYTTIKMNAYTSNKAGDIPTASGTTNNVYMVFCDDDDFVVDGLTLEGSAQGHYYNGLRFEQSNNPTLTNAVIKNAGPGNSGTPPGETTMVNFQRSTGAITVTNVTCDGGNVSAAAIESNTCSGTFTVTNYLAINNKYSAGWASWQQTGNMAFYDFVTSNTCRAFNAERLAATVDFYNPIWNDPFSGHYDINYTWETGYSGTGAINFRFSNAQAWNNFIAGRAKKKIQIIIASHGFGTTTLKNTVKVYVGGVLQTTTDYVQFTGS